jgi:predicted short-subunit dehydrogenase-like oxidoreductase (DUF2520 family)
VVGRSELSEDHPLLKLRSVEFTTEYPGAPDAGTRVLLTVPDADVPIAAAELAAQGTPGAGCTALHMSGALPSSALQPLADLGYAVGSLHPLQTIADQAHGAERLRGAFFAFEGDAEAREAAVRIVNAAGGRLLEVHAADKARYHAACVFASNYVVACAAAATRLLADAVGVSREEARRALEPLWGGAVANLNDLGLPEALTGPIARGDLETLQSNLSVLDASTRALYAHLGLEALALSRELGLDDMPADAIEEELRRYLAGVE